MTESEQPRMLEGFVADLKQRGFTDYLIRRYAPHADCKYHSDEWEGRYLLLEGSVTLEIASHFQSFAEGDTYAMQANTLHREVFGPAGGNLVVARRKVSERPLATADDAISLSA